MNNKGTLTTSTYRNAISQMVSYLTSTIVVLILQPLLLRYLGNNMFGVWKICQRLLTFISAADGRATQALKWTLASKQHFDDLEEKRRNIGCAIVVWFLFLPLTLLLGGALVWFSPNFIKGLSLEHFAIVRITCLILVLEMIFMPLRSIPEATLVGINQAYRCNWVVALIVLLSGLFSILLAYCGYGIIGVAVAFVTASVFGAVLIFIIAKKSISWFGLSWPKKYEVRKFMNFSIWVALWTIVNKLLLSGDILILGLVGSATMVSAYVLTTYTVNMAVALSAIFVSAGIPGLGGIVGSGDFIKASNIRLEIMTFSWLVSMVFGSMFLLWNQTFIGLWVGQNNYLGDIENLLIVIMMIQLVFIRTDAFIVDVTLNIRMKVQLGFLSNLISYTLAYILASFYLSPAIGILSGIIIGRSVISLGYPILISKAFNKSFIKSFSGIVRPLIFAVIIFAVSFYIGKETNLNSWCNLIFKCLISLPFVFFVSYQGLSKRQRQQFQKRLSYLPVIRRFKVLYVRLESI